MNKLQTRLLVVCLTAFAWTGLTAREGGSTTGLSLSHVWMGDADLDHGGEMGSNHTSLRLDLNRSLGRGESIGFSLGADFRDYDFSGISTLTDEAPWGKVAEYTAGISWRKPIGDDGLVFLAPSIEFARGEGADWGDSIRFGTIASYGHRFSENLTVGIGAGIYTGLEETKAFPVLLVDWRIGENWRVGNPFRPGPTGPAGIEIVYSFDPEWEIGFGGGWRSTRFRLDEDGINPDGIGEVEGFPAFARLSWSATESVTLDLYGGLFLAGELTYEDRHGNETGTEDMDTAPIAAISVTAEF
jgi:hypothetical protein